MEKYLCRCCTCGLWTLPGCSSPPACPSAWAGGAASSTSCCRYTTSGRYLGVSTISTQYLHNIYTLSAAAPTTSPPRGTRAAWWWSTRTRPPSTAPASCPSTYTAPCPPRTHSRTRSVKISGLSHNKHFEPVLVCCGFFLTVR